MTTTTRKTYIGKERDDESYFGDFGVRKYDYAAGNRFTSPDVLWQKYIDRSPYNYCGNNPISASDASGYALLFCYRAPNTYGLFDPGHMSLLATLGNNTSIESAKQWSSWSFTPKDNQQIVGAITVGTKSRQADIKADIKDATKTLTIETNQRFDKIIIGLMDARKQEEEKYQIKKNNCVTTLNEIFQRALEIYGSDINIMEKNIYKPEEEIKYLEQNKTKIENSINK